jgi:hypothetical protein
LMSLYVKEKKATSAPAIIKENRSRNKSNTTSTVVPCGLTARNKRFSTTG